jgi:CheY-like chemotaxis protein
VPITILSTGQTGVERGAYRAASSTHFRVEGYCTFERRDELGTLPEDLRAILQPWSRRGVRSALYANVDSADFIVIAVPSVDRASSNTGMSALRRAATAAGKPCVVIDPSSSLSELAIRLRTIERDTLGDVRVFITGPRGTRWQGGEILGFRLVSELSFVPAMRSSRDKYRVLVVDDHRDTAETLSVMLRAFGHEARAAINGRQGLELASTFEPEIGLFDIGLPDISGYELAKQLRAARARIFLAAITGWDQARDASLAFAAGFDRHVVKPAGAEIIRELLEDATAQLAIAC